MKWTNEDVTMVEKFIDIKNKGYYCDGGQLTEVYNRVLEKSAPPTNCRLYESKNLRTGDSP